MHTSRSTLHHRLVVPIVAATIALSAAACGGGGGGGTTTSPNPQPTPSPNLATVQATASNSFTPSPVAIAPGGTVKFEFGTVAHTVVFSQVSGAPADIPSTTGATVDRVFGTAGTFNYHCTIHPGMAGSVVVSATTTTTGTGGTNCGAGYTCQ